tara:strand:+ start:2143 stop:3015 length:873 start_codon:yes stop_codon:yes gene_type:complete
MRFTIELLGDLKDSGKSVCIYSKSIAKILNNCYNLNSFQNFSTRLFYYWRDCKKAIPLEVVIKIMKKKKLKGLYVDFFSMGGGNKIKLPKDKNLNFCYLLGLILGDGCLIHQNRRNNRNTYSIKIFFRKKEKAEKISLIVENLFGINPSIYSAKGCYALATFSKPLVMILNKKYEIPIGIKYGSICIPELILNGNKNMKICFLKGVFESDGNIYLHKNAKCVQLRQKSESFLREIKELFNQVNLDFRDPYYDRANNSWVLWSSKKSFVDNFIKQITDFNLDKKAPIVQSG